MKKGKSRLIKCLNAPEYNIAIFLGFIVRIFLRLSNGWSTLVICVTCVSFVHPTYILPISLYR